MKIVKFIVNTRVLFVARERRIRKHLPTSKISPQLWPFIFPATLRQRIKLIVVSANARRTIFSCNIYSCNFSFSYFLRDEGVRESALPPTKGREVVYLHNRCNMKFYVVIVADTRERWLYQNIILSKVVVLFLKRSRADSSIASV